MWQHPPIWVSKKSGSYLGLSLLYFSTLRMRGEEWLFSCQAFATRSPDQNQHFCVFSKAPWLFYNINWAETKFWAKMEEMVSDVSVKTSIFQPCSFTNSLIYSGTFKEERRGLSLCADVNQQFMGWGARARSCRNLWKEEFVLRALSLS